MKFNLDDFLQLDTNGLLAVNGGSGCSSGASSGGGGCGNVGSSAGGTSPNSAPKYPSGQGGSSVPSGGNNGGGTCGNIFQKNERLSIQEAVTKHLDEKYIIGVLNIYQAAILFQ